MTNMLGIQQAEFFERVKRLQNELQKEELDGILVFSNEADMGNVRYLCDYWPNFELAGVFVPTDGTPWVLCGPESESLAKARSVLQVVRPMAEYREAAAPDYPGLDVASFKEVFSESSARPIKRLGIASPQMTPMVIYERVCQSLPKAEIVNADHIMNGLRIVKSPAEIECIRRAHKISEQASQAVFDAARPAMTELQISGLAQPSLYAEEGSEGPAYPVSILSGENTYHPIPRACHRRIEKRQPIQTGIGARFCGYSSSVSRVFSFGRLPDEVKTLWEVAKEAHLATFENIRPAVRAADVARKHLELLRRRNAESWFVYGPAHGVGLLEAEWPYIETTSDYEFVPGMTFEIDTFLRNHRYGVRFENGAVVTETGCEQLSGSFMEPIEL